MTSQRCDVCGSEKPSFCRHWSIRHSQVYFSVVDAFAPNGDEWTATRNTKDGGIDWWRVGRYPHGATRTPAIPSVVKDHAERLLDEVSRLPFAERAAYCAEHASDFVEPPQSAHKFQDYFTQNDR